MRATGRASARPGAPARGRRHYLPFFPGPREDHPMTRLIAAACAATLLALATPGLAQEAIRFDAARKTFVLDAGDTTYALGIDPDEHLQFVYWGPRLWRDADFSVPVVRDGGSFDPKPDLMPEEYPGWGGPRFVEPAVKVTFADGVRGVDLVYVSHAIAGDTLTVRTKDKGSDLAVDLAYRVHAGGLIEKRALVTNRTKAAVTLESAQAGVWSIPRRAGDFRLTYVAGHWGAENQLNREPIRQGIRLLESRRGNTSHSQNPWFAIDQHATESTGEVWFGALAWSGNFRMAVEQTAYGYVRVTGGFNTFDFSYRLEPGQSIETMPYYGGYTTGGFGAMSRMLHRFETTELMPQRGMAAPRPVLYNSWEATTFDVTEEGQKALADKAADLGVELFVIDDGWFGARNTDKAGLGDWVVNRTKFPNGLKATIDHVKSRGMTFGIWVEPEMINPDSDLYRAHPDWVMNFPGRPRTQARNQLVLNMARDDVKEHIFTVLDRLASENDISFFKWDMNRHFSEPGWPEQGADDRQKKIWVQYTRNVYEIIDRLRAKHPDLAIESCSGGGGRVDLGILRRVDQTWTSDNTDALSRVYIQHGHSFAYAPRTMVNWVTDVPNFDGRSTPLKFRFTVAMMGTLGIGSNLNRFTADDTAHAKKMIALYKRIRGTVQMGDLYRLLSPYEGEVTAAQYVARDGKQAVVIALLRSQMYGKVFPPVRLEGLDDKATYAVEDQDGKALGNFSGAWLEGRGLQLALTGDYDGTVIVLTRQ
jgi:alpha-galactosidase